MTWLTLTVQHWLVAALTAEGKPADVFGEQTAVIRGRNHKK